jgi:hypothetical protein
MSLNHLKSLWNHLDILGHDLFHKSESLDKPGFVSWVIVKIVPLFIQLHEIWERAMHWHKRFSRRSTLFFLRSDFFIELLAFRLHFDFFLQADFFDELLTNFVSQTLNQFLSASFLLKFCLDQPALFVIFFFAVLGKVF